MTFGPAGDDRIRVTGQDVRGVPLFPTGLLSVWPLGVSLPFAVLLGAFMLRRTLFLAAALLPARGIPAETGALPSVTLLVPASDEEEGVDRTLAAIGLLDYPADSLRVVLVNDGSRDGTGDRFRVWAAGRPEASVIDLPVRRGKFSALNEALARSPATDVIAVCDADLRPLPGWLRRIVASFTDARVGAVAGYLAPANADGGAIARYAAVETWVHQLVTSAAKDRLNLDPPTLGACAYRRDAFEQIGRFGDAPSGEDVRASAELARAGWRTRFVRDSVAENLVVHTARDYWHQHIRWARNLFGLGRARPRRAVGVRLGPGRRLETWFASAGYADRLAFVVVAAFAVAGVLPLWLPGGYVALAATEVVVAVVKGGAARRLPRFLGSALAVFALDVAASGAAVGAHVAGRPRIWRQSRRDLRAAPRPGDG